jgi:hypothetical protein
MAINKRPYQLNEVTEFASDDKIILDSVTEGTRSFDANSLTTDSELNIGLSTKEPIKSANDNYVTDAEKIVIQNTSGTNTGDQDLSGLVTKTTTVNGKALSSNIILSATDVGAPTISSGSGTPSSTPAKTGDIYVDTTNYKTYISKGTSSSADWIKQNGSYALSCGFTTNNPPASSTLYFGQCNDSPNDTATKRKIYPQRAGKISAVAGEFVNVASSSEKSSLYIRVNNTTDYLISSTIATDTNSNYFSNNALSIPIADGDFFELKLVTPAWAQAPASCRSFISVYVDL